MYSANELISLTVDVRAAAFCGEIIRRMSIGDASAAMARSAGIVRAEALVRDARPDGSPACNRA